MLPPSEGIMKISCGSPIPHLVPSLPSAKAWAGQCCCLARQLLGRVSGGGIIGDETKSIITLFSFNALLLTVMRGFIRLKACTARVYNRHLT